MRKYSGCRHLFNSRTTLKTLCSLFMISHIRSHKNIPKKLSQIHSLIPLSQLPTIYIYIYCYDEMEVFPFQLLFTSSDYYTIRYMINVWIYLCI